MNKLQLGGVYSEKLEGDMIYDDLLEKLRE